MHLTDQLKGNCHTNSPCNKQREILMDAIYGCLAPNFAIKQSIL